MRYGEVDLFSGQQAGAVTGDPTTSWATGQPVIGRLVGSFEE